MISAVGNNDLNAAIPFRQVFLISLPFFIIIVLARYISLFYFKYPQGRKNKRQSFLIHASSQYEGQQDTSRVHHNNILNGLFFISLRD